MKKFLTFFTAVLLAGSMTARTESFLQQDKANSAIYTVAGNSVAAFGTSWDPSNTANEMIEQYDGTYIWKKSNVAVSSNIEFKVVEGHAWGKEYPSSNYVLTIPGSGSYTITILFNPDTHDVYAEAVKDGEAVIIPTAKVAGEFEDWSGTAMTNDNNNLTASLTLTFEKGEYPFKMIIGDGNWRSTGGSFTRESNSAVITGNENYNMTLVADVDGDYTFTWTYATNELVITFPERVIETTVIDVDYAEAVYLADDNVWKFNLYKDWDSETKQITYPDLYIYAAAKSETAIAGKYSVPGEIESIQIDLSDDESINATSATDLIITSVNDKYNYDIVFYDSDDNVYILNVIVPTLASRFENEQYTEIELEEAPVNYYLVGSFNDWATSNEYLFQANPYAPGEYMFTTTLAENDELKVVAVQGDIQTWYPGGQNNNYIVDADHAGEMTIYFRPEGNEDWIEFHEGGFFYISEKLAPTGVDNIRAARMFKYIFNNQIIIERDGVRYNVIGQVVR